MPLTAYETDLQNLLQLPGAPTTLYSQTNLDLWINKARGQVAGEGECIRAMGTLVVSAGTRNYNFSSINTGTASVTGIDGVINVRRVMYMVGNGYQWITPRPWEWFDLYHLNNPVPVEGVPTVWAQYGQGAAPPGMNPDGPSVGGGSFYIDPPPDQGYTLSLDCVCYPIALTNDSTVEALPYLWSDAVPFFAAYYALLSAQTGAQDARAARMYEAYKEFLNRARQFANPSVNRPQYEQANDPVIINKLGVTKAAAQ